MKSQEKTKPNEIIEKQFTIADLENLRKEVHTLKIPDRAVILDRSIWEQEPIFKWCDDELNRAELHPEGHIGTKNGTMCFLPMKFTLSLSENS